MSDVKDAQFSLKVVVNKQKTKVHFAEVDTDFADVLLSFLTLPLGTIAKILKKHYGDDEEARVNFGSLTSLYNGLANLDNVHFWTEGCKKMLLNTRCSFEAECRKLKLDISDTRPPDFFTCENRYYCSGPKVKPSCLSVYYDSATCSSCGKTMKREVSQDEFRLFDDGYDGVFALRTTTFIISDDLYIFPNTTGSIQTLRSFGIIDTDLVESMNVTFGFNEIMDLLKGSLLSRTPLSDIVFSKGQVDDFAKLKIEPEISLFHDKKSNEKYEATSESKKVIILTVMVQKSTNKILYAESEEEFVDFLSSLLTIPLGGVESLLSGNTCLKSIDSLYKSVKKINGDKYLATRDIKNRLLEPKLLHGYISTDQILPLTEEMFSPTCYVRSFSSDTFVNGQGKYIRGSQMYKITDDLTVTPLRVASTISVLKELKIPLSDVKELELEIRLEEALSILKASLTSTSVLTNGLKINPMSMKQPKQEQ